jgi:hypothetical protein
MVSLFECMDIRYGMTLPSMLVIGSVMKPVSNFLRSFNE